MGNAQVISTKCCHCTEYGTYFCYDCRKALCSTCRRDHDLYTSINRHFVTEFRYVNHQLLKADLNCSKHGQSFSLYCSSCKTLACNECVTTSHVQHEFCDISTTVRAAEDDLNTVQSKLQEKRNILLYNQTKIKSEMIPTLNTKKEAVQKEMQNTVSTLKKTIDTVKEVTENLKEEIYVGELNKLTTTLREIEKIDNMYSSTLQLIKRTLSEKHNIGFLNYYQSIKEDVNSLEEIIDTVEDGNIPVFDSKDFTHKIINCMLLDMNESKIQDKDNAIEDLQEQVKLLTEQIQCLQRTAGSNNITIKNLKSENFQLKSSLGQTTASMKDIEIELQTKINDLQKNLNSAIQDNIKMKNSKKLEEKVRQDLKREKGSLAKENAELKEKIKSLQRIDDNTVAFKERMLLDEQYTETSYQQFPKLPTSLSRKWEMSITPRPSMSNGPERKSTQLPILLPIYSREMSMDLSPRRPYWSDLETSLSQRRLLWSDPVRRESDTPLSRRNPLRYYLGRYNTHKKS